jgi:pyruvate formate lyase activating enzyme
MEGLVFDLQRCSYVDGPGVRTTIFLKGCPLRCAWCHNPESRRPDPEPAWEKDSDPERGPFRIIGWRAEAEELARVALRDIAYYRESGGGVTLSGGEPLAQPAFARELARIVRAAGVQVCLDTSGEAPPEALEDVAQEVDLFLWDLKALPGKEHLELVGSDGFLILQNLRRIAEAGAKIVLRCPLVPGQNDAPENLGFIAELSESWPNLLRAEILPYHDLGAGKRWKTALGHAARRFETPGPERLRSWAEWFERRGARKVSFPA